MQLKQTQGATLPSGKTISGSGTIAVNSSGTAAGLTGTPDISVGDITASGNVSIGGTLTYEDVTNIDSVGLITARTGIAMLVQVTATVILLSKGASCWSSKRCSSNDLSGGNDTLLS